MSQFVVVLLVRPITKRNLASSSGALVFEHRHVLVLATCNAYRIHFVIVGVGDANHDDSALFAITRDFYVQWLAKMVCFRAVPFFVVVRVIAIRDGT